MSPLTLTYTSVTDPAAIKARWLALEHGSRCGFYRSWCFLNHQIARLGKPWLVAAQLDGQDMALALLDRREKRIHIAEAGDNDPVFMEHNGLLVRQGAEWVIEPVLRSLCAMGPVVLSGVDEMHAQAARRAGRAIETATRPDPFVFLDRLAGPYLDTLSANTRSQIRRAMKLLGPDLKLTRSATTEDALEDFGAMVGLHQLTWQRRGKPGAFADPDMMNFHERLIADGLPAGQIDVLAITSNGAPVGYLYNFLHDGRVYCYQSGFADFDDARIKPGLVSHTLAIEHYREHGARTYDLLAGASRYKASLAPGDAEKLHWLVLYDRYSLAGRKHAFAEASKTLWRRMRASRAV